MLNAHVAESCETRSGNRKPFWIDLFNPTAEEKSRVAADYHIEVPLRESLQEIETSSQLKADGALLYVSMPLSLEDEVAGFAPMPLGFILSSELLVTVRYSDVHAFGIVEAGIAPGLHTSSAVFVALIEAMVDFYADSLERLSNSLAALSARVFGPRGSSQKTAKHVSGALRECLMEIGIAGDHLSRTRESMLGLQRIIGFVLKAASWWSPEEKTRLGTAQQDLTSVVDFQGHLVAKTQFILDAILGFINTEQNDIFKVLTIASVVGIPPMLIASMYGMNFRDMPELSWRWGYPYGLALIVLSIVFPILWFKRRRWW
jgi:magnesium transporter